MQDLLRVLEEEIRLYDVLSDCLKRQGEALVRLERGRLESITLELEALVSEVRRVSTARAEMVRREARTLGRKGDSLRDLVETAPEPHRSRFAQLRRELLARVRGMEGLTGSSRILVEDSLAHIRAFVRLLAGLAGPGPVYPNPRLASSSSLVDRSA